MTDMRASPVESGFLTGEPSLCGETPGGTLENLHDNEEYLNTVVSRMSFRNRLESISMNNLDDQRIPDHYPVTAPFHFPSTPNIPDSYMKKKEPNPPETTEAEPAREAAKEWEPFLSNAGATGDEEEKRKPSGQTSGRLPWCIAGFLAIVIIILAVLLGLPSRGTVKTLSSCGPPCNESWIWVGGRCYYFSDISLNWNKSQKFCTEQDSTLAVLIDQGIKKTIERYRENMNYWIGLSKNHEERWMWTNGSLYDGMVENDDIPHLRCAYLNSHLGALDCSTGRRWICVKDSS